MNVDEYHFSSVRPFSLNDYTQIYTNETKTLVAGLFLLLLVSNLDGITV